VLIKVLTADVVSSGQNINAGGVKFPGFGHIQAPAYSERFKSGWKPPFRTCEILCLAVLTSCPVFPSAYHVRGTGKSPAI